jgi:hypothetical protein
MDKTNNLHLGTSLALLSCLLFSPLLASLQAQGMVEFQFSDSKSGEPVSARMLFTKSAKRLTRPKKLLFSGEQWLAEQSFQLAPPNGEFEFLVQRGPEFNEIRGGFTIEPRAKDKIPIAIPRSIDMHAEHWYSGDHLSGIPLHDLQRWQLADAVDLVVSTGAVDPSNVPPKIANSTDSRRKMDQSPQLSESVGLGLGCESVRLDWGSGAVLLHGSKALATKITSTSESMQSLDNAIETAEGVVPELIRPWSRDVPLLLASNSIRSVQILSTSNRPNGDDRLAWNKEPADGAYGKIQIANGKEKSVSEVFAPMNPVEMIRFKDARAVGKISEAIYWQMLEAGMRITPTAGSGFLGANDKNETQVGYNRVYLYSESTPNQASWWQAISKGHTFVSNGPLLRANINGVPPGSVQTSYRSQSIPIDISVSLSVRDPVDYLDVVFNGETLYSAKLEDHYKRGEFPPLEIDKSGWLVIRVVTDHAKGYRFATTAPFYFVFDAQPRISRKAVEFFQNWHRAAVESINKTPDLKHYEAWIERSQRFWDARLIASNCD